MKKKIMILLCLLGAAVIGGGIWFAGSHVHIGGHFYAKNAEVLDVRQDHLTPESYDALCAALPHCKVQWELELQGRAYPLDAREVTVTALTPADEALLARLTELEAVDATAVTDWEAARDFALRRPEEDVRYCLPLCGTNVSTGDTQITVQDPDAAELLQRLPLMRHLQSVTLTGQLPERAQLKGLTETMPQIDFSWTVSLSGKEYANTVTRLELADTALSAETLTKLVDPLLELEYADVLGCPISQRDMEAIADTYPEVFFLWEGSFFGQTLRTDVTEIDISETSVEDAAQVEAILPYFRNLRKLVMCHCGLDDETMDALNRRHEDVQIVWAVRYGQAELRTDITWFVPWVMSLSWLTDDRNPDMANLRYCTELTMIDVGHEELTNCDWAAYMPKLKYLIIGDTGISDLSPLAGLESLEYLEAFRMPITDYSPLLECKNLKDLNIGSTYGDAGPIEQMTWLENLWWHLPGNPSDEAVKERWLSLPEKLPDTHVSVGVHNSSTDCGWRDLPNYFAQRDIAGLFYMVG